jgi:isocitrate/isopropylmalate dehydrogenase
MTYQITLVPGDGIGPEVTAAAQRKHIWPARQPSMRLAARYPPKLWLQFKTPMPR